MTYVCSWPEVFLTVSNILCSAALPCVRGVVGVGGPSRHFFLANRLSAMCWSYVTWLTFLIAKPDWLSNVMQNPFRVLCLQRLRKWMKADFTARDSLETWCLCVLHDNKCSTVLRAAYHTSPQTGLYLFFRGVFKIELDNKMSTDASKQSCLLGILAQLVRPV